MNYINPFSFFDINSLNASLIQKAKKEKLTELALSKKHYILYQDIEVDDDLLIDLAEDLLNPHLRHYHDFINDHPRFSDFLENGQLEVFEDFPQSVLFESVEFRDFLYPYLEDAFQMALVNAYQSRDLRMLKAIQNHFLYKEFQNPSVLFGDLKIELEHEIKELKRTYKIINYPQIKFSQVEEQLDLLRSIVDIECINALPRQLVHFSNSIALLLCNLSKRLYTMGDAESIDFFEFADLANQLHTSGHAKTMVDTTYRRFRHSYYERLGLAVENDVPALKANDEFLSAEVKRGLKQMDEIKKKLSNRTIQSKGLQTRQASLACSVLENISTDNFLLELTRPDHSEIRLQVLSEVFFILKTCHSTNKALALSMIQQYQILYRTDVHYLEKYKGLEQEIEGSINDELVDNSQENLPLWKVFLLGTKEKASEHWNVVLDKQAQWLGQDLTTEEGKDKAKFLLSLILTGILLAIVFTATAKFLTGKYELSETQVTLEKRKAYRWNTKDYTKEKFYTERSKYVGNQLPNGSQPFKKCFGDNIEDGNNTFIVQNPFPYDAVMCLYNPQNNQVIQQAYVQSKAAHTFINLPDGTYSVKINLGKDWNPIKPNFCSLYGAFDTESHYFKMKRKHNFELKNGSSIYSEWYTVEKVENLFYSLSAASYFNNRIWK